ncbi:MAG: YIP1 family protein [Paracoccaceae bacterium]
MSVVADIAESWRHPARVMRRHLARGRSEPFAFSLLMVFLLVAFIAYWPAAARVAALDPGKPVAAQLLPFAMGGLAAIPMLYLLAAFGAGVARVLGGRGGWYGGRMALFWALVVSSPLVLLSGLVAGLIGPGLQQTALNLVSGLAFLVFWAITLKEAGQGDAA